jgi:hypothetical protein
VGVSGRGFHMELRVFVVCEAPRGGLVSFFSGPLARRRMFLCRLP